MERRIKNVERDRENKLLEQANTYDDLIKRLEKQIEDEK